MSIPLPPLPASKKYLGVDAEPDFTYYTESQLRARDLEVVSVVLEAAANVLDGECLDHLQRAILALEFTHD